MEFASTYLHSNMDRLKRVTLSLKLSLMTYLHSNMDRLKRYINAGKAAERIHLHSNMDRLKPAGTGDCK